MVMEMVRKFDVSIYIISTFSNPYHSYHFF